MGREKGVRRGIFPKPKATSYADTETDMEEELEEEVKEVEPGFLREVDTGIRTADAPNELRFWVSDGKIVKNLRELADALRKMSKETFKYHVTKEKNDFSTWVAEVIGDRELAEKMKKARSQKEMAGVVGKAIKRGRITSKIIPKQAKKLAQRMKKAVDARARKMRVQKPKVKAVKRSTYEQLAPKPRAEKPRIKAKKERSLRDWEQDIIEREHVLNDEEQRLNERKVILSKKRLVLLKERSEMEKQKFERFLSGRGVKSTETRPEIQETPAEHVELVEEKSVNELNEAMAQARAAIDQGKSSDAMRLIARARELLKAVYLGESEKRRAEYDILELEADAKLASLSGSQ